MPPHEDRPEGNEIGAESPVLYANRDKTKIVAEDDPDAAYQVNPNDPGEFEELVKRHREGGATRKAKKPDEDK